MKRPETRSQAIATLERAKDFIPYPTVVETTHRGERNWDIFSRDKWLSTTVEHTARAFLGVTIQCARCHDHKFDPILQKDYYRLQAFFANSAAIDDHHPFMMSVSADGGSMTSR